MIPLAIRKAAPTLPAKTRKAFFALLRKVRSLTERQWTIIGIAIVALMAAGPIWFVTYDLIGQKAWKNYEAAARARGEKLYLADMEEPSISDADNFAALPIFRNTLSTNQRIPAFPKGDRPTFASAQTGIRFDVDLLRTYFAKAGWIDSPSQDIAGDVRLALLPYRDAIEEINGGLKRPHCSFGTTWTPNPYKTSLSYPRVIYPLVDVVALHANAHLAEGNSEAALEDLRLITGIRNHLASAVREQTSNLRVKISGLQASIVYEGLARHAWNQQQLRDIIELLNAADPLKDMADWLEMERAIANGWFDWILAGNLPAPSNLADYTPERWFHNVKVLRTFPGIVRRNQLQVAKFYSGLRAEIDLAAGVCPVSKLKLGYDYSAYYWLAYFPIEGIDDWRRFYLVHAARSRLALIACALELYHSRHLRYPQTLLELAPRYLPALPHEPTKKRNFIYYPTDDGRYRLYSRGPNGKDDRGALGRYKLSEKESRSYPLHRMADVPWTAPPPR